jgi:hypothetical protein
VKLLFDENLPAFATSYRVFSASKKAESPLELFFPLAALFPEL